MPFIGQEPITGAFHKLDAITTSSTNTYNLLLNGGAFSPESANNLMVSLNGVIQSPGSSFTVSGSQITFIPSSGTLSSDDSIDFIMALGNVLDIGTPSDGTVSENKIAAGAVTDTKIANSAITDAKIAGMAASKLTGALPALDGSALTGLIAGFTFTTGADISGGATATFTGIPSTATNIRVYWFGITPGSGYPEWRLGHSGGNITTGYFNQHIYANHNGSPYTTYNNNANSFRMPGWTATDNTWYGAWDFKKQVHTNGNSYWHMGGDIWNSQYNTYLIHTVGFVNAGTNVIDRYYFGSSNGSNITSGQIQIGYI